MAWNELLTMLNYTLARLYPMTQETYRIVEAAGLPITQIAFQPKAIDNWYSILDQADKRGKVLNIVQAARKDWPDEPVLINAEKGDLVPVAAPVLGRDLNWDSSLSVDTAEKLMESQSTLLPISFLEVGLRCARSIARVRLSSGGLGSGFLTHNNLFITNHHVFKDQSDARTAVIQFNYQQNPDGLDLEPVPFELDPDAGFATSFADDWTAVRVKGDANAVWGAIDIQPIENIHATKWVNIIQHPGGGSKQIALYHNIVAYVDEKRVQYLTDTLPGSSGSPVFDSHWRLVALHHSGGWILEPNSKKQVFRNEGININCVIAGLTQNGLIG